MKRYIDANELKSVLIEQRNYRAPNLSKLANEVMTSAFRIALRELDNIPTAKVKEVICCKDCKYFKTDTEYCKEHNKGYCEFDNTIKSRNHFCGYADRKDVKNTCEVKK